MADEEVKLKLKLEKERARQLARELQDEFRELMRREEAALEFRLEARLEKARRQISATQLELSRFSQTGRTVNRLNRRVARGLAEDAVGDYFADVATESGNEGSDLGQFAKRISGRSVATFLTAMDWMDPSKASMNAAFAASSITALSAVLGEALRTQKEYREQMKRTLELIEREARERNEFQAHMRQVVEQLDRKIEDRRARLELETRELTRKLQYQTFLNMRGGGGR